MSGTNQHKEERREPHVAVQVLTLCVVFLGGGIFGVFLASVFAPDSILAATVGLFMLPLAFGVGMQFWLGLALFLGIVKLIRWLFSGNKARFRNSAVPPGSFVFIPVSVFCCLVGGVVTASVASAAGFIVVWAAYLMVGFLYGICMWKLASKGYLPFMVEG